MRSKPLVLVRHHMTGYMLMGMGGAEYTALETAIALSKNGFRVYLHGLTLDAPYKLVRLAKFYGIPLEDLRFGLGDCSDPDLIFNTSGDVLSGLADIIYFHFPSSLRTDIYYSGIRGLLKISGYIYSFFNRLVTPISLKRVKLILANSSFTAMLVEKMLFRRPVIVYPPVNLNGLKNEPLPREERDTYILMVSRISYEKQPEKAILVAKILKQLGFTRYRVILAGAIGKYSRIVMKRLMEYTDKYGVKDYLDIRVNPSREELIELYRKAMLYVHPTEREHFGISVVEAMAAGTPVIVPINSGSWTDILSRDINMGLPYRGSRDLKDKIKQLITNHDMWFTLSRNGHKRSLFFDRTRFHKEISAYTRLVYYMLSKK